MGNLRQVYAVQSNDGDWYVIPHELKDQFIEDSMDIQQHPYLSSKTFSDEEYERVADSYYKRCEDFEEDYGRYATGGDLNNTQLYAEF